RVSDVRALDLLSRIFTPQGVIFHVSRRMKTDSRLISHPDFDKAPKLCVVRCLKAYEQATEDIPPPGKRQLLISIKKPVRAVSSSTIA
ncbi:hypothetical protein NDU88_005033, partial [Pleurodeles waltl]